MEHRSGEQSLKERIRSGHIRREDVTRRLAESGGTACEDAALQAAHALGQIGISVSMTVAGRARGKLHPVIL